MLWQVSNSLNNVCFLYKQINIHKKKPLRYAISTHDYFKNKKYYFRIYKNIIQRKKFLLIKAKYSYINSFNLKNKNYKLQLNNIKNKRKNQYKYKYTSRRRNLKTFKVSPFYQKVKFTVKKRKLKKKRRLTLIKIKKRLFSNIQRKIKLVKWTKLNNRKRKKLKVKFKNYRQRRGRYQIKRWKYSIMRRNFSMDKYFTWGLRKKILKRYKKHKKKYKLYGENKKLTYLNLKMFKMLKNSLTSLTIQNFLLISKKRKYIWLWSQKLSTLLTKYKKRIHFKRKRLLKKKYEKRYGKYSGKEFERQFSKKFDRKFKHIFGSKSKRILKKKIQKLKKILKRYFKKSLKRKTRKILSRRKKIDFRNIQNKIKIVNSTYIRSTFRIKNLKKKKKKKPYVVPYHKRFFKKANLELRNQELKKLALRRAKRKKFKYKKLKGMRKLIYVKRGLPNRRYRHLMFYYLRRKIKTLRFLKKRHFYMSSLYKHYYKKEWRRRRWLFRSFVRLFVKKKRKIYFNFDKNRFKKNRYKKNRYKNNKFQKIQYIKSKSWKIPSKKISIKKKIMLKRVLKAFGKNRFYRVFLWEQINFGGNYKFFNNYNRLKKKKRLFKEKKQKSPRLFRRYFIFRKLKLKRKRAYYYFLSTRIPTAKKKKRTDEARLDIKNLIFIRKRLKIIKERCNISKNAVYTYTLKKTNLIYINNVNKFNVNNYLWLNNKLFESYLLKFFFSKKKLISKLGKKKKKKNFFF